MNGAAPLDTLGMWEATVALPEQLSGALRAADDAFAGLAAGTGATRAQRRRLRPGHRRDRLRRRGRPHGTPT